MSKDDKLKMFREVAMDIVTLPYRYQKNVTNLLQDDSIRLNSEVLGRVAAPVLAAMSILVALDAGVIATLSGVSDGLSVAFGVAVGGWCMPAALMPVFNWSCKETFGERRKELEVLPSLHNN